MTISEQIQEDIKAHIIAGETLPYPLTLSGIAGHFKASLMPARTAVEQLIDARFLFRNQDGSLGINTRRRSRDPQITLSSLRPTAPVAPEKMLAEHIISLSLRGTRECLREEVTAEEFGIGRTVLRRIFNRFSGEGIIEHLPRRGWRVRPYSETEMLDYIDIRETLELRALELAMPRLDRDFVRQLILGNSPDASGRPQLDNRLHRHWIDRAENRYLSQFFDQNGIYYETLFAHAVLDDETVNRRAREHCRILRAVLGGDLPKAKDALSKHIRDQRKHVARLFQEAV
ncbi:MAG: GntR family transcriptional regulator [Verrucomicrobiaceae bacterium]|nr:GntR family transcriptional regulator [Verrucomicrobiaceae bacterium]